MEIGITKMNGIRFIVWIDDWDTDFDAFNDARRFYSYIKHNYPKKTIKIEVILVECVKWDGEHGEFKKHVLATIKT